MGAQRNGIDLLLPLVAEPGFDHVLGEDIAPQQEGMVGFERIERLSAVSRAWTLHSWPLPRGRS